MGTITTINCQRTTVDNRNDLLATVSRIRGYSCDGYCYLVCFLQTNNTKLPANIKQPIDLDFRLSFSYNTAVAFKWYLIKRQFQ
jgi:hypothetical protein